MLSREWISLIVVVVVFFVGLGVTVYSVRKIAEIYRYKQHLSINPFLELPVPDLSDYEAVAGLILGLSVMVAMGSLVITVMEIAQWL